jgi:hypothetical protein
LTAIVIHAQDSTFDCPDSFTGYVAPRLIVGEQARVLSGHPVNIRPDPSTQFARVGVFQPGENFPVQDGPRCNEGYVWWQTVYENQLVWIAEGSIADNEYWLEPRGAVIFVMDRHGQPARYVQFDDGFVEPEGCLRPPDDYTRISLGFATLNARTLAMLDQAQRIYDATDGPVNFRQSITQGSYNPGGVDASFGTHDAGGAVDISVRSFVDFSVLTDEIEPMVDALRTAGFAAWLRDTHDLYPDSPIHIHAIAVGDAELSPIAREQIDAQMGYLRGYDGLPREDGVPVIERHGGPVICRWMVEMGFDDLRESSTLVASANRYLSEGKVWQAISVLSRALELDPQNGDLLRARGHAYYDVAQFDLALADYRAFETLAGEGADALVAERILRIETASR